MPDTYDKKTPNSITAFIHCQECLKTRPKNQSPREWARLEVGYTAKGLQLWCTRHEMNIANIDFLGQKVNVT